MTPSAPLDGVGRGQTEPPTADAPRKTGSPDGALRRPSLADEAEEALRNWLAPGRHRPGDRLPPEPDMAEMLGISRGTLRTALKRLEAGGEIVRRQGSGTFVGQVIVPLTFDERLERLEPYSSLAERRGKKLSASDVHIEARPVGPHIGERLGLVAACEAVTISRLLLADRTPAAVMLDVVHPDLGLPAPARLRRALERGRMVLDLLIGGDVPIAFARTRVTPRLLTREVDAGRALGVKKPTAVLELEEVIHVSTGAAVAYSCDIFAPDSIDLQVIRSLGASQPVPIIAAERARADRRRRAPAARRTR